MIIYLIRDLDKLFEIDELRNCEVLIQARLVSPQLCSLIHQHFLQSLTNSEESIRQKAKFVGKQH